MNPSHPNDPLSRTLAEWRVNPKPDPTFRPAVWERIKQRSRETWSAYLRAHLVVWTVTGAAALVTAGWTGHLFAETRINASREQMVVSYLNSLDPRVMAKVQP